MSLPKVYDSTEMVPMAGCLVVQYNGCVTPSTLAIIGPSLTNRRKLKKQSEETRGRHRNETKWHLLNVQWPTNRKEADHVRKQTM